MPRPKKIFSSTGSESVEVRRLGEIYWIYVEALPSKSLFHLGVDTPEDLEEANEIAKKI